MPFRRSRSSRRKDGRSWMGRGEHVGPLMLAQLLFRLRKSQWPFDTEEFRQCHSEARDKGRKPGEVFAESSDMLVSTGDGVVKVVSVQIEGKKSMTGPEFLNGHRDIVGAVLGS